MEKRNGKSIPASTGRQAATNRLRVLDSALVRSGRFDRVVNVKPPDAVGREKILRVHARKVVLSVENSVENSEKKKEQKKKKSDVGSERVGGD